MENLKTIVKSMRKPEESEEDPNSGFSTERFLKALNACKVKLSQIIQNRQEKEAEIKDAPKPVAKKACVDKKLMKKTRSGGRNTKSIETGPDFPTWAASRMANHKKSKGSTFPHVDFEAKTKNTLRKVSSSTSVSTISTLESSDKEELSSHKTPNTNDIEEEEKDQKMPEPETLEISSGRNNDETPPNNVVITKDTKDLLKN